MHLACKNFLMLNIWTLNIEHSKKFTYLKKKYVSDSRSQKFLGHLIKKQLYVNYYAFLYSEIIH